MGAVRVSADLKDEMEVITEDTYNALLNNEELTNSGIKLKGEIKKLESQAYTYLKSYMMEMGYSVDEVEEYICPYYLDVSTSTYTTSIVFILGGLLCILVAIFILVYILSGLSIRKAKKVISQNGSLAEQEANYDYQNAKQLTKAIRIGKKYTYINDALSVTVINNDEVVWVYWGRTEKRAYGIKVNVTYSVNIATANGKIKKVSVKKEAQAKEVVEYYDGFEHIILGYSDELLKMFNKDREEFMNLKYNSKEVEEKPLDEEDRGY